MSRSKKDILDTEAMLQRLTTLLIQHAPPGTPMDGYGGTARTDAESLRRISMTLHRWHELECGDSNNHASWTIARGRKDAGGAFEYDDSGKPYLERHFHNVGLVSARVPSYRRIPDRETGARKRLAAILKRYPTLTAYVQTDPRGCALYILKPGDVPEGASIDSCYSRGLAVYQ